MKSLRQWALGLRLRWLAKHRAKRYAAGMDWARRHTAGKGGAYIPLLDIHAAWEIQQDKDPCFWHAVRDHCRETWPPDVEPLQY